MATPPKRITRLDCSMYCVAPLSGSEVVFINPQPKPGSLLFVGSSLGSHGFGGQMARTVALSNFLAAVLKHDISTEKDKSLSIIESGFKGANDAVYAFAHKMAAAGKMSSTLLSCAIEDQLIALGRVGPGAAYLLREEKCFPFFEESDFESADKLVGSRSLITVELASVPLEPRDVIILLSEKVAHEAQLEDYFSQRDVEQGEDLAAQLCNEIAGANAFAAVIVAGPASIQLR